MSNKISRKIALAVGLAAAGTAFAPAAASAAAPDVECQRAGMAVLRDAGLFSSVAAEGLPISTAVAVGVTVRPGADISGVSDPIPLKVVLADHRAGDSSLFVYPWCDDDGLSG